MCLNLSTSAVVSFSTETVPSVEQVGKKALGLIELAHAGFEVPDGFCVTVEAYESFLSTLVVPDVVSEKDLARVRERILNAPLPREIAQEIEAAYEQLGGRVAVRSSGIQEDMAEASFAGQYHTVLGVEGLESLMQAIRDCWASAWAERVWSYCKSHGLEFGRSPMGVVVQTLIPAESAGVLFTVNPMTGLEDEMAVEACWGFGEALVSGRVEPDRYILDGDTGVAKETTLGRKEFAILNAVDAAGTREVPVEPTEASRLTLDSEKLKALCDLGNRVQEYYGCPQDIEFAYAVDRFYLLQSRPITKLNFTGIPGEWTTADFRDGGVSSSVVAPYMWSLYELIWEHSMPTYLDTIKLLRKDQHEIPWSHVFYGRPYWNMGEVKRALWKVPGFKEREFDLDLGISPTYEGDGVAIPYNLKTILGALPTLFALNKDYRVRLEKNKRFVRKFPALEARYDSLNPEMPFGELLKTYREMILKHYFWVESSYFLTIFNISNAKLDFKAALEKATKKSKEKIDTLHLMVGLKDIPHLKPLNDLWEIARLIKEDEAACEVLMETESDKVMEKLPKPWAERLSEFCHTYRYHSTSELDLRVPNWDEDPTFVIQSLRALVTTPEGMDPMSINAKQHEIYLAERAKLEKVTRSKDVFAKLELVRSYGWWREYMRDHSSRMYYLIRRWTLILAKRLVEKGLLSAPEDVFYLRYQEVISLAEGNLSFSIADMTIRKRKSYNQRFRNFKNPNEVGSRYAHTQKGVAEGAITGVPCSPGRTEGTVRVIRTLSEASRLGAGDILVTTFTDPGWTPLFGVIKGVVTETGGFLSHAAVVSREYGIPAVLSVPDATLRLKEGQRVAIDGNSGSIEVLE